MKRRTAADTALVVVIAGVAGLLGGCGSAKVLTPSPNDALRAENQQLRERIDALSLQVGELESRAAQHERAARATKPTPATEDAAEIDAATPRLAVLQIEGASEVILAPAGSNAPATLRLRIVPRDGRGRFLQIVGRLTVGVACLRAGEPPVEIARADFGPSAVRDAWRGSVFGSHYAFDVELPLAAELHSCAPTVSIRFDDAVTGKSFDDERRLAPPRDSAATLKPESSNR